MAEMTVKDFTSHIGAIVINLQALETAIRFFFFRKNDEQHPFPKTGVNETPSSSLTAYVELGKWIRRFNSGLTREEIAKYKLADDIVEIRDAIAHGRLIAPEPPKLPYTLWKFDNAVNGVSTVRFSTVLTDEWLKETSNILDNNVQKIVECHKARGYRGY